MTASFVQLDAWKKAHQVAIEVYVRTRQFPREERFTLAYQMRKAASSIGANIAEGYGRRAPKDKAHFYTIATGSSEELKSFLLLARDLDCMTEISPLYAKVEDVSRMLHRLIDRTLEQVR